MADNSLITLARQIAGKHGLNDALVCAICEQESAWNPTAKRYEPAFYKHYVSPLIYSIGISDEEATDRSTSWGLMQLMGQVARELGFTEPISTLCDPATGLDWGCKFFAQKLLKAGGDAFAALQRWNGGANSSYAGQVIARMDKYVLPLTAKSDLSTGDL